MNQRLTQFKNRLQPCSDETLDAMACESRALTLRHFGHTMRLFAPLYLSNECVNSCRYCGFSRANSISRITLSTEQVEAETRYLLAEGFRSILLVAGDHPEKVSTDYLVECILIQKRLGVPSISLEIGPRETEEYRRMVAAGAEGLVVYQETYDRKVYAAMHPSGPKKDSDHRLNCPDRAYTAGFRRIGIGALLGLAEWQNEALALAAHLDELLKRCWKSFFTVSIPRLRPAAGAFQPPFEIKERDLIQLVCALRITFPQVGIVLSTREPAPLRDLLSQVGVTLMSAGSSTEPGGYTVAGAENPSAPASSTIRSEGEYATEQFLIADARPVKTVVNRLRQLGYDPVWKDWDPALTTP